MGWMVLLKKVRDMNNPCAFGDFIVVSRLTTQSISRGIRTSVESHQVGLGELPVKGS